MAIQLSIIIVNYNVKAFLEQCLYSVFNASRKIDTEVIVVDNNSVDDSVEMLQKNFPRVKLICNTENKGFAYACNQGIKLSESNYILLLNPDTVINENSLTLCLDFMESHDDAGALGVKMIDGKGIFLPESKRSLPTASSAFFKMFGLSRLFPKSKTFGKYQLQFLDADKIHEVEVLSGAFMFIRKKVLDEIGFLDESFFMYGEDIDLSFRMIKAGYKNYYFPLTTIIHYKGESTKKASVRYVRMFYQAMLIFSKKHYKGKYLSLFRFIILIAIYFRASISVLYRILKNLFIPLIDFTITYSVYIQTVAIWEYYKFSAYGVYSPILKQLYVPAFILIWLLLVAYFKGNHPFTHFWQLFKSIFAGTLIILVGYSLLPEQYRYSRALILIGAAICFSSIALVRIILRLYLNKGAGIHSNQRKAALLIGNFNDEAIQDYRKKLETKYDIKKIIKPGDESFALINNKLSDIIRIMKIDTIIYFLKDIPASDIINSFIHYSNRNIEFKMVLPLSSSIVGSQSVVDLETLPQFRLNPIVNPGNRLKKRILDILVSIFCIVFSPVFLIKNNPVYFFSTLLKILLYQASWISYTPLKEDELIKLPKLKPGVYNPLILQLNNGLSKEEIFEMNLEYVKNYKMLNDLIIIFRALRISLDLRKFDKRK